MKKTLAKKLGKMFRKEQRKNLFLGIKRNEYKLAYNMPLEAYEELLQKLNGDEIYELKKIFNDCGQTELLIGLMPSEFWINVCCSNLNIFFSFLDEQLRHIINNVSYYSISRIFYLEGMNIIGQNRIIELLNLEVWEEWILDFSKEEFRKFNCILISYVRNKNEIIFQKISNMSNFGIAKLIENTFDDIIKKIFENVEKERIYPIYKEIKIENLYKVLVESRYNLLEDADREIYTWIYENLPCEDKEKFVSYLLNYKMDKLELFNEEICKGIISTLLE